MKNGIYIALFTIFIAVLGADISSAQSGNTNTIYSNFRKLERYVMRVKELVRNFDDAMARSLISQARAELERARYLLFSSQPPRPGLAKISMGKTLQLTNQAARLVLRKPFANLKSQLDNMINRAEQAVSNSKSDEAYYLLNQAKKFRRWSYAAYNANEVVKGQEYYRISHFFARKCLDFVSHEGRSLSDQLLDFENSIRQLLSEAEELIDTNTQAALGKLLEEAEKYFQEALQLAEQGKQEMALRRLQLIKRFIYRIFDQAERADSTPESRVGNGLYSLRSLLQALQNDIEGNADPNVEKLLESAWNLYREAEQAFENKDLRQAQNKISLCQRFANKVFRLTRDQGDNDFNEIQMRIEETHNLLKLQENKVQESGNESIIALHEEAIKLLNRAQEQLELNNLDLSFQLLQAATRMTARIQRELKMASRDFEKIALENKYKRIQDMLNRLEGNEEISSEYGAILIQLRQFATEAWQYIQNGEYILAEEYLNTVLEQIRQFTTKWRKEAE
jgi:hypothetical protein